MLIHSWPNFVAWFWKIAQNSQENTCEVFENTYFVEYLEIAFESVRYLVHIFISKVHSEEKEEYENYLRITTECFDELFVLVKNNFTR